MNRRILSIAILGGFTIAATSAMAAPVKLSKVQMDQVVAGAITQTNNGGHTPNGKANGIPKTNPTGFAPPGQNK